MVDHGGVHHPQYRVVPAGFARGFWIGLCKVCPPGRDRYQSGKGSPHSAETAVIDHLKDKHDIEAKEATA
jgi:hypothetical protein